MLENLHKQINDIVAINGLSKIDDNFVIHYINQPTQEQQNQINIILESWPLQQAKDIKLKEIEDDWNLTVKNGWETSSGWKLGIDVQDVTLLTGAFMLAKEASALGINEPIHIIDTYGESHALTLPELTTIMLQYGNARSQLSSQYANRVKNAKEATSIEQLESI